MNSLLLLMGLLLVAYLGSFLVGGERSVRGVGLPSSVEWVVLGFVVGPRALGVVSTSVVDNVQSVVVVGLSWLMLTAGVQYATTDRGPVRPSRIAGALGAAAASAGAVFSAVYFTLPFVAPSLAKHKLPLAIALAAISCETTRGVMRWVRERYAARGPLTDLIEDVTAADDLVPIGLLAVLFAIGGKSKLAWLGVAGVSGVTIGLGAVLGTLCGLLLGREFRLRESWGTVLGISLLGIGVSAMVGLAFVSVLFVMGALLAIASRHADEVRAMLAPTERGALLPILIVCGVRLESHEILRTLTVFGVVLAARIVVALVVARLLSSIEEDARGAGITLGLGLLASGSLTMCIGLVCAVSFQGVVGDTVLAVAAALCIAGELFGPPSLRASLGRAGELHPESREVPAPTEEAAPAPTNEGAPS